MSADNKHTAPHFSPWSIARTIWKGRWTILAVWSVISIAGGVGVQLLPTIYVAQALILVDSQKIPERFVASTVSTELQDRIASISQQIVSSAQLTKIINDFGLYRKERASMVQEDIIDKMRKDVEIKTEKNTGFAKNKPGSFRVSYQGSNPSVVAQVANKLAELFINENLKTREVQAEGTSEFLDSQLQEAKKTLDTLEVAVGEYKVKHNGELPQQEGALGTTLARLQGELNSTRDAISRANDTNLLQESALSTVEVTLQALREQSAADGAAAAPRLASAGRPAGEPVAAGSRPIVAPKRSDILRAQLEGARVRWRDDHPEVKRLKADLAQAEEVERVQEETALEAVKAAFAAKPADGAGAQETAANTTQSQAAPQPPVNLREIPQLAQLRERIQTLKTGIELNTRDIEKRKTNEQHLLASIAGVQSRIDRLPLREQEMAVLMRDYGISSSNYQKLLTNKLSAGMSKDMELRQKSERFTVLDPATVPDKPSKPNRPVLSAGFSGFGLFLGLGLAFLIELRRDVFLGEWELPGEVVVLGTLPRMEDYSTATVSRSGIGRRFFRKRAPADGSV